MEGYTLRFDKQEVKIELEVTISFNEREIRALNALAGYVPKVLVDLVYERLGRHYLGPYEKEMLELLSIFKDVFPSKYSIAERARMAAKDVN